MIGARGSLEFSKGETLSRYFEISEANDSLE